MNKALKTLTNGILRENPTFALVLGMCPTLATTTSAINGMSMGLATTAVLICSNIVISLLTNLIPDQVRRTGIPARCLRRPRLVHPADCGELYRAGSCRGVCSEE